MTYKCKYCLRDFVRENTLITHSCEIKRRAMEKDNKQNRIAYSSWLLWLTYIMSKSKKNKSYDDFISNRYFTGFMKLAKFIIDLNMDEGKTYVEYISMKSLPMSAWTKDSTYESFIKEKVKKEPVERAIERSILNMKIWAERTGYEYTDYFSKVNTPDAVQDIRMGRISPWCTFATDQGSKLIDRLEPMQIQSLIEYIEPKSWRAKIIRQRQDSKWVQDIFNKAEIK